MKNSRILMVDDDETLCEMVVAYLRKDGFEAEAVNNGELALKCVQAKSYDAMILDLMMPGMSGHEVLRRLMAGPSGVSPMPVLMLTARGDDVDRIIGLESGADDYLAKPCNLRELAARLRAIMRRSGAQPNHPLATNLTVNVGDLILDVGRRQATQAGQSLALTGAEFSVLQILMENVGETVSKEIIMQTALGREYVPYDRSIDVHVANLRKKIASLESSTPAEILTVRGAGYRLATPRMDS